MSTDYADQGQRRSAERKAWVKTVFSDPDKTSDDCRSELAREDFEVGASCQTVRVIVHVHRERARSYRGHMVSEAVVVAAAAQGHDARTAIGVWTDLLAQVADVHVQAAVVQGQLCLLYTSPSPRDRQKSRMPSSA